MDIDLYVFGLHFMVCYHSVQLLLGFGFRLMITDNPASHFVFYEILIAFFVYFPGHVSFKQPVYDQESSLIVYWQPLLIVYLYQAKANLPLPLVLVAVDLF